MFFRLITGGIGLLMLLYAVTWPRFMPRLIEIFDEFLLGVVTLGALLGGIYLVFFGLTGDWLPHLNKRSHRD
ncbi:MAG: hypothetical protein AAGC71_14660 [Pseudomonadota bacterium]